MALVIGVIDSLLGHSLGDLTETKPHHGCLYEVAAF
jgi:hypothetical protein